jgi:phage terminase large subunit
MPNLAHDDRISAVKTIFPRCHFSRENAAQGLECLRNYRFELNDKSGVYGQKPVHDWASDGATAFENIALGYDSLLGKEPKKIIKRPEGIIFNDLLESANKKL